MNGAHEECVCVCVCVCAHLLCCAPGVRGVEGHQDSASTHSISNLTEAINKSRRGHLTLRLWRLTEEGLLIIIPLFGTGFSLSDTDLKVYRIINRFRACW